MTAPTAPNEYFSQLTNDFSLNSPSVPAAENPHYNNGPQPVSAVPQGAIPNAVQPAVPMAHPIAPASVPVAQPVASVPVNNEMALNNKPQQASATTESLQSRSALLKTSNDLDSMELKAMHQMISQLVDQQGFMFDIVSKMSMKLGELDSFQKHRLSLLEGQLSTSLNNQLSLETTVTQQLQKMNSASTAEVATSESSHPSADLSIVIEKLEEMRESHKAHSDNFKVLYESQNEISQEIEQLKNEIANLQSIVKKNASASATPAQSTPASSRAEPPAPSAANVAVPAPAAAPAQQPYDAQMLQRTLVESGYYNQTTSHQPAFNPMAQPPPSNSMPSAPSHLQSQPISVQPAVSHPANPPQPQMTASGKPKGWSRGTIKFDEKLITDAINMGFSREQVENTLHDLYEQGKPANDMNSLIERLCM